jgi:hypothetical protein
MLSFEYEPNDEALLIHGSPESLRHLASLLNQLADGVASDKPDHLHLMSPSWGGTELSNQAQSSTARLFHHVKIMGWP